MPEKNHKPKKFGKKPFFKNSTKRPFGDTRQKRPFGNDAQKRPFSQSGQKSSFSPTRSFPKERGFSKSRPSGSFSKTWQPRPFEKTGQKTWPKSTEPSFKKGPVTRIDELRKSLIRKTREQVTEQLSGKEIHIVKAVNLIEDLDSVFNLLAEQVIDWHSYHFPELKRVVKENDTYLSLVFNLGDRKNFSKENVMKFYQNEENAQTIFEKSNDSLGAEFEEVEINELKLLALSALNVKNERGFLQKFLEEKTRKAMPNSSALVGEILAAKMLAHAGSLKRLAFVPSSTIQLMGAEKALYMHLKTGSRPPKHGIIFQHPQISSANKKVRGKIARLIASKLSIAAKLDFFGGKNEGERLKKEVQEKIAQMR